MDAKTNKRFGGKVGRIIAACVFVVLGSFACLFYGAIVNQSQPIVWDSGIVIIDGKSIQLPYGAKDFEDSFGVFIEVGDEDDYFKSVHIPLENGETLDLRLIVKQDMVTGLVLDIHGSNSDAASAVIFPGGVSAETPVSFFRSIYRTFPLNTTMRKWSEKSQSGYYYRGREFNIDFTTYKSDTWGEQITEIMYYTKD